MPGNWRNEVSPISRYFLKKGLGMGDTFEKGLDMGETTFLLFLDIFFKKCPGNGRNKVSPISRHL